MQIEKSDTTWKWARCCHDFPQFSVKRNFLASIISTSNSQESLTFLLATDHISPNSEVIRSSSTKVGCRCPHHMNSLSSSFTIIWFSMRYLKSNFKTLQKSVVLTSNYFTQFKYRKGLLSKRKQLRRVGNTVNNNSTASHLKSRRNTPLKKLKNGFQ